MKKIGVLIILLFSITVYASNDYVIVDQEVYDRVAKEAKQDFEKKGYKVKSDIYTNGYVRLNKRKSFTFGDKQGNILKAKHSMVTDMFKNGTFISGKGVLGMNDYGGEVIVKYTNLLLHNADGSVLKDINAEYPDYQLASNQIHQYRTFHTDSESFITFHKVTEEISINPDGKEYSTTVSKVGLMNGKGKIVLQPNFDVIEQVTGTYFKLSDDRKSGTSYILDVVDMSRIPVDFELLVSHGTSKTDTFHKSVVFENKLLAKSNGMFGIYDLASKSWALPNAYEELKLIHAKKNLGLRVRNGSTGFTNIIYTDKFLAKKHGKWGSVKQNGEIIVPFEYKGLSYGGYGDNIFAITKINGKKNLYDFEQRKEFFPQSYDSFSMDSRRKDVIIVKNSNQLGIIRMNPYSELVSFSEGYIDFTFENSSKTIKLKKKDRKVSLFSVNNNKIIWKDAKKIKRVTNGSELIVVHNFDKQLAIIDADGNIVLPFGRYSGAVKERNGHFMFYSVHKPNIVRQCVARTGEILAPNACK